MRVLELFCGIGGCAAALEQLGAGSEIVGAVDIHPGALDVYARNFPNHPIVTAEIAAWDEDRLRGFQADLWWMSPPCQPFTRRGLNRDLDDPRCRALRSLIERLKTAGPEHFALENVPDFASSRARDLLRETLDQGGYDMCEWMLCPSDLGVPNRRRRFYLLASRRGLRVEVAPVDAPGSLREFIETSFDDDPALFLDETVRDAYRDALHVVDRDDESALTACFTSAYGRSHVRSGSYLRVGDRLRRFAPREILALLGFPARYDLPASPPRRLWPLVGNSLSLFCVRHVLRHLPWEIPS